MLYDTFVCVLAPFRLYYYNSRHSRFTSINPALFHACPISSRLALLRASIPTGPHFPGCLPLQFYLIRSLLYALLASLAPFKCPSLLTFFRRHCIPNPSATFL